MGEAGGACWTNTSRAGAGREGGRRGMRWVQRAPGPRGLTKWFQPRITNSGWPLESHTWRVWHDPSDWHYGKIPWANVWRKGRWRSGAEMGRVAGVFQESRQHDECLDCGTWDGSGPLERWTDGRHRRGARKTAMDWNEAEEKQSIGDDLQLLAGADWGGGTSIRTEGAGGNPTKPFSVHSQFLIFLSFKTDTSRQ